MSLAQSETNLLLRSELVTAVLRGWAAAQPLEAAHWAMTQEKEHERAAGLLTVMQSAVATDPAGAVRTSRALIAEKPDETGSLVSTLINVLASAGNFAAAAEFASTTESGFRTAAVADAYVRWAIYQPQDAAEAASRITDSTTRRDALRGTMAGWAQVDPAGAMLFGSQLPAGPERGPALSVALQRWAHVDPVAASQWIEHNEIGEDMDRGVAAIATTDALKPSVAAQWAEIIVNPQLRSQTLANVLTEWVRADPAAARKYFETTTQLRDEDRTQIAEMLASASSS